MKFAKSLKALVFAEHLGWLLLFIMFFKVSEKGRWSLLMDEKVSYLGRLIQIER